MLALTGLTACRNTSDETDSGDASGPRYVTDRLSNTLAVPGNIETIVTLGASNTEIVTALGFGDRIIAMDTFSVDVPGVASDITLIDLWNMDIEALIMLEPDVIFAASGLIAPGADGPLEMLIRAGTHVMGIPTAETINDIILDIEFIGAVLNADAAANAMTSSMVAEINNIRETAAGITTPRTVYFEIEAPPFMFTFGEGTFMHEMVEAIGAVNAFGHYGSWVSIADEQVLALDPDVILTNVVWIEDHLTDMQARPGWDGLTAIQYGRVFVIDANASSRPTHNITTALRQMAEAVYPEYFR